MSSNRAMGVGGWRWMGWAALVCGFVVGAAALPQEVRAQEGRARQGGTIRGRAVGSDGGAPRGAEATLPDQRRKVEVGGDGGFVFADVPPGSYLVLVVSPLQGHGVGRAEVVAGETVELEIELHVTTHSEEVVVSASPDLRSQLELASPTTVVRGEELDINRQATLGETLGNTPGVRATSFAQGASRPVIRGLSGDRVRMLTGGIGSGDASSTSPDHGVAIDPATAERIEILRGPATLLYGSSAIGGVVNVEDGRIPLFRRNLPLGGQVEVGLGSVADERRGVAAFDGGGGDWAWHVDGRLLDAGAYEIPGAARAGGPPATDGRLPNSDNRTAGASVGGTRFFDGGSVGIAGSTFDTDYGLPADPGVRIEMEQQRFDLRAERTRPFGPFRGWRLRAGVGDYEHVEIEDGEAATMFFNDSFEARAELVQQRRGRLTGSVGVQLSTEALEVTGEEAFLPPTDTAGFAVFAFEELAWERWRLQLGGRYDRREVDPEPGELADRDFGAWSASVGTVFRPTDASAVRLSVARSSKLPNGQELFSDGVHVATSSFEIGDAELRKETSLGIDLGVEATRGRLTGELTLFAQDFDDFIFAARTGEEIDGLPVSVYGQTDARFRGGELEGSIAAFQSARHHLDLKVFADWVRAEQTGNGQPLPRIPPFGYGLGIHFHGERYHARLEWRRRDDQRRVDSGETPTAGYSTLDASFSYRFVVGEQIYDVLLRGRNLTDEEIRQHTSFVKDRVPMPGRDLALSLRLVF